MLKQVGTLIFFYIIDIFRLVFLVGIECGMKAGVYSGTDFNTTQNKLKLANTTQNRLKLANTVNVWEDKNVKTRSNTSRTKCKPSSGLATLSIQAQISFSKMPTRVAFRHSTIVLNVSSIKKVRTPKRDIDIPIHEDAPHSVELHAN